MHIKINNKSFDVNENVVPDSLIFMLQAYYNGDYQRFYFWKRQFDNALYMVNQCSVIE